MMERNIPVQTQSTTRKGKFPKTDNEFSINDTEVSMPEMFYTCDEIPAQPHSYLRYFELNLLDIKTGRWLCDCRVASPHFMDSSLVLTDAVSAPSSFLTLNQIQVTIKEAVEKNGEWKVMHILFYDMHYKRFQQLVEENFPQCLSYVFRVLVKETEKSVGSEEGHQQNVDDDKELEEYENTGKGSKNEYEVFIPPHIKALLAEDCVSNPSFLSEVPNKPLFVFEPSQLYPNSARVLQQKLENKNHVLLEEENNRNSLRLEGGAEGATLLAVHILHLSDMEFRDRIKLFILEEKEKEMTIRKEQQKLLKEVRDFMANSSNKQPPLAVQS